jgi:putative endonuclease
MQREFGPTVYILASRRTIYTGVTSNLVRRIHQHREGHIPGFTREHGAKRLVWFEQHAKMEAAIAREKRIKKWNRVWKLELIEKDNLVWRDLAEDLGFPRWSRLGPRFRGDHDKPSVTFSRLSSRSPFRPSSPRKRGPS